MWKPRIGVSVAFTPHGVGGGADSMEDRIKHTERLHRYSGGLRMIEDSAKANWDWGDSRQQSACFSYHPFDFGLGDLINESDDLGCEM
jgi:hypothetical protein